MALTIQSGFKMYTLTLQTEEKRLVNLSYCSKSRIGCCPDEEFELGGRDARESAD
jgi:hypothetical protein